MFDRVGLIGWGSYAIVPLIPHQYSAKQYCIFAYPGRHILRFPYSPFVSLTWDFSTINIFKEKAEMRPVITFLLLISLSSCIGTIFYPISYQNLDKGEKMSKVYRYHECDHIPNGIIIVYSNQFGPERDKPVWHLVIQRKATEADLDENYYLEEVGETIWSTEVEITHCPYRGQKLFDPAENGIDHYAMGSYTMPWSAMGSDHANHLEILATLPWGIAMVGPCAMGSDHTNHLEILRNYGY